MNEKEHTLVALSKLKPYQIVFLESVDFERRNILKRLYHTQVPSKPSMLASADFTKKNEIYSRDPVNALLRVAVQTKLVLFKLFLKVPDAFHEVALTLGKHLGMSHTHLILLTLKCYERSKFISAWLFCLCCSLNLFMNSCFSTSTTSRAFCSLALNPGD